MDHDRLFREVLTTFFVEFLELLFPELVNDLDRDSIEFLDNEAFADLTPGDLHSLDLVARVRLRGDLSCVLIHVEHQARPQSEFAPRILLKFARLMAKYGLPVYPIAVYSHDEPNRREPGEYRMRVGDLDVLRFAFRVVRLNLLDWRSFVESDNPLAACLMAKMRMDHSDRPTVKLACLTLLARLRLDPVRRALIFDLVDMCLRLAPHEEELFRMELARLEAQVRKQVESILAGSMHSGIEREFPHE